MSMATNSNHVIGPANRGEILVYRSDDGQTHVDVRMADGSAWLTQRLMADLFQVGVNTINHHIKGVYTDRELAPEATIRKYRIVQSEGGREVERTVEHYRLEMILAVGFRVRSARGAQFRQWATARLEEYLRKGFVMDDERLKHPPGPGGTDYFDEILERIRDIRSSEMRMYLRVREILALAADYDPKEADTQVFFQTVQNKLHFAVSGKTAPELIAERADHAKPNMGLTAWRGSVVRRGDVTIAKNYLNEAEIFELNRIVNMFLEYAEDQARRRKQVFMRDWRIKLDDFLRFNERDVLDHAGSVSREEADMKVLGEYEHFADHRRKVLETKGEEESMQQLVAVAKKRDRKVKP